MKVAAVGNMNNGLFALTRHLRDRDIDAELFFAPSPGHEHFHPKADTFDLRDLDFCHEVPWLDGGFYSIDAAAIRRDLRAYDVVLATGAEAAALSLAGMPIDIYFPYGDDVFTYAQLPEQFTLRQIAREELRFFLKRGELTISQMRNGTQFGHVRRAICTARYVLDDMANDDYNRLLLSLPLEGTVYRSPWPMIYPKPYRDGWDRADVHWRSVFDRIRSEHEFILLYHGRHEWTREDVHRKNNHHLLLGFAEFVRQRPDVTSCLVTVEYGRDVGASKAMIADLRLGDRVIWFPRMYRKDLMYLVDVAHLCAGQFDRSFLTFGTILEALCVGKPVIHHRDDALYRDIPLFPVVNAREPAEIAAALAAFIEDPDTSRQHGLEGRAWFDEHAVQRPLDAICELLGRGDNNRRESLSQESAAHVG